MNKLTDIISTASKELLQNGWEYNGFTKMKNSETKFWGQTFTKGGRTFYLNIDTMHNIPQN